MSLIELLVIAIALSMDAFAVSICKGVYIKNISIKKAGIVGLYFGIFQATMPLIGYYFGHKFQAKISSIDHWIVFIVLGIIGLNMIRESRDCGCEITDDVNTDNPLRFKSMIILAIATSIDALAVGITFALLNVNIKIAVLFIGIITLIISMIGVKIGNIVGNKFKAKAEVFGGVVLILIGTKTLLEHLSILNF